MNNKIDWSERFASMWRKARNDGGVSQEFMSKALGVSKTTVQNWEAGISCPSQLVGLQWFEVLGLQPLPYYLDLLYSSEGENGDGKIDDVLTDFVRGMSTEMKWKLAYCIFGEHGSSPAAILEMVTAYLHTPLDKRFTVCGAVLANYKLSELTNTLIHSGRALPNMAKLQHAMDECIEAVRDGNQSYSILK